MKRICFTLNVRPECIEAYKLHHREVWPEMRAALAACGWTDYSLFLRQDGLLIGYLLTEDFDSARSAMKQFPINARWQEHMAPLFAGMDSAADEHMKPLEEIFHLD